MRPAHSISGSLAGGGSIVTNGPASSRFRPVRSTRAAPLADSISGGNVSLVKVGIGTLTLSNGNSYGGGTTLSSGTLSITNSSALGSGTVTLSGGTLFGNGASAVGNNIVVTANTTTTLEGGGGGWLHGPHWLDYRQRHDSIGFQPRR